MEINGPSADHLGRGKRAWPGSPVHLKEDAERLGRIRNDNREGGLRETRGNVFVMLG